MKPRHLGDVMTFFTRFPLRKDGRAGRDADGDGILNEGKAGGGEGTDTNPIYVDKVPFNKVVLGSGKTWELPGALSGMTAVLEEQRFEDADYKMHVGYVVYSRNEDGSFGGDHDGITVAEAKKFMLDSNRS